MTRFNDYLYTFNRSVSVNDPLRQRPLPLHRTRSDRTARTSESRRFTLGDYFDAVRSFLEFNGFVHLKAAMAKQGRHDVLTKDIKQIDIRLAKHGECYHPAEIIVGLDGSIRRFVLNAAVSPAGKSHIDRECRLLNKLGTGFPYSFVPQVYAEGPGYTETGVAVDMFLGEWFDGFYEFHLSPSEKGRKKRIAIWDFDGKDAFLPDSLITDLYSQAALILTLYFNLTTFEHISDWHHGAGDFVIGLINRELRLKLITVRQYAPMFRSAETMESNDETRMIALLLFLIHMSVHMRLDRDKGVGKILWADDIAVKGVLKGFLTGLTLNPAITAVADNMDERILSYITSYTYSDLLDPAWDMMRIFEPLKEEATVIRRCLKNHIQVLYDEAIHCLDGRAETKPGQ